MSPIDITQAPTAATPTAAASTAATPSIERKPIPTLPGRRWLGHLPEFRDARVGLLLRVAETHPELVHVPLGVLQPMILHADLYRVLAAKGVWRGEFSC